MELIYEGGIMIKLLRRLDRKSYIMIFATAIFVFIQVWLDLKVPEYMANVTRLVQTPGSPMSEIWKNGLYMLLCTLGSVAIAIITGYLIAFIASTLSFNLREGLFKKVSDLPQEEIDKFGTSSLITRTTNDVTQVEMFVTMGMMILLRSPIMAIWGISKIIDKGVEWSYVTGVAVLIMLTVISFLVIKVIPKFKIIQELTDELNGVTREHLTGIRVVRAFNAEKYQEDKNLIVNEELTKNQKFSQKSFSLIQPLITILMEGLTIAIYLIGVTLIQKAELPVKLEIFGNMIVFSSYAIQIIMSFLMMAFLLGFMSRAQISAGRINEVFNANSNIVEGNFEGNTEVKGQVEFRNVSFKYPDAKEYVLKDISFTANKGETVAFIGMTGSGKSTLVKLLPRFFDVTGGEILVDGINVKEYTLKALYKKIGYVSQKAVIFNMSVNENIAFGEGNSEFTEESIKNAIEIAQGKDFVEKLDNTYETVIARGGSNISGGQKQRLSIARAIARDPEIYIFDDSFSALDFKTESKLRKELREKTKEATSLVVASRVGSVLNADKIVVLKDGKIDSMGSHKDLWNTSDLYREIALSQLSEEELNEKAK